MTVISQRHHDHQSGNAILIAAAGIASQELFKVEFYDQPAASCLHGLELAGAQ
jgi:hypothetical protein